ncbi:MAG: hypothetical protein CL608_13425, partial [Anaerolineaceae bacterium]|nr:hypothetical protein [Anaerolineaceae bacterium]
MIILKRVALISLLFSLLLVAACTAESEPSVADETTTAPSTIEPTPIIETVPTLEPTAAVVEEEVLEETAVPTETAETAAAADDFASFTTSFQTALAQRDFAVVQETMADPFGFGPYRSEWSLLTPAEAVAQLENILPQGAAVQFNPDADLIAMLDGQDPQMMMGPDVTLVAVWHTSGWGAEGQDEAILFIEGLADGRFAWKAMIIAPDGFLPESAELPIMDEQPAPVGLLYSPVEGGIWQIGTDGQPQQLTAQQDAIPSPDGRHAFFQIQGDLWLLDIATGETRVLTTDHDDQGTHLAGFHWWYDNDTILSGIWLDFESDGGPNFGRPALIDIATGEVAMVDSQHLMSSYPAISASGAIAYSSVGKSADDTKLYWIYRPDTGVAAFNPAEFANSLTGHGYASPAWSVDGRFLAWLAFDGYNFQLAIFDLENNSVVNQQPVPAAAFGGPFPNAVFSPDSRWIALRQLTNDFDNAVCIGRGGFKDVYRGVIPGGTVVATAVLKVERIERDAAR